MAQLCSCALGDEPSQGPLLLSDRTWPAARRSRPFGYDVAAKPAPICSA